MNYTEYQFLYPPRPEVKIAKTMLGFYQNRGYIGQKKKNGTCTVVFSKGDDVIFKTRHNDDHKMWTPQNDHIKFFQGKMNWNVYVGELLHSKVTNGPKHELYLFDQLVQDGKSLTGASLQDRMDALEKSFGSGIEEEDQYRIALRITRTKCFKSGFEKLFNNLKKEDEGLVLKDPKARLKACYNVNSNRIGQVKCRIAHSNYSF